MRFPLENKYNSVPPILLVFLGKKRPNVDLKRFSKICLLLILHLIILKALMNLFSA